MANAYITNTSRFKPFTFQEMIQPYALYTEAYNTIENEMSDLNLLAEDVASKLNNPLDKELQQKALTFQSDLKSAMSDMYEKGLTPETRKKLINLKSVYSRDLNPINEAYKAYQEDQKYLAKMAVEHPEILIEGAGKSLSDYMGGKSPKMISVNTDDLMNQAMAVAKTQAGRTYRQSDWGSTAGGRFLERVTETGLNDVDFNNALFLIQNPNITAKDLGITDAQFAKIKNNASLINSSMSDIIDSPSFMSLSEENKKRAMNSVIKGVRAGFQYDKKTDTESDPMFAYNLKMEEHLLEQALKDKNKKEKIGTDYFYTPDTTKIDYANRYLNTLGVDAGKLNSKYDKFFKDGKLLTSEEANKNASSYKEKHLGSPTTSITGYVTPYSVIGYNAKDFYLNDYNDLRQAVIDLGLNPDKLTKEDFVKVLNSSDATGRKRLMITPNSTGFSHIKTRIESGLKNDEFVQEIVGLNPSSLGNMGTYRTQQGSKYKDLLDSKGNLNLLGVNLDPATGQLSAQIKTPKGKYIEILLPDAVTYNADDAKDLRNAAFSYSSVAQGMHPIMTYDDKGNQVIEFEPLENGYIPRTKLLGTDYMDLSLEDMKIMFGDMFNVFGTEDVNG